MPPYAELQVTTNFSFLRGASHPESWRRAAARSGSRRSRSPTATRWPAWCARTARRRKPASARRRRAARSAATGRACSACPTDRAAYGRLARLITLGRRRAPKGECDLTPSRRPRRTARACSFVAAAARDAGAGPTTRFADELRALAAALSQPLLSRRAEPAASRRRRAPARCGSRRWPTTRGVPLVATNDVHHARARAAPAAGRARPASASTAPSTRPAIAWPPTPSAT